MILSIISAIGKNNEIGKANTLLCNLPIDMKHFKETTSGHPIIMGQKTFESIGRPLPNRRNIIITQNRNFKRDGLEIVYSKDELIELLEKTCDKDSECFVIGGGMIYKLFIDVADKLYITHVNAEFLDADTYFPAIDENIWQKAKSSPYKKDEQNAYDLEFVEYTRKV